jgi:hypothetical protein
MEHRWGRRQPTNLSVQFFAGPGTIGTGRLVNISATGAFMETSTPLRPLCIVNLGPLGLPVGESKRGSVAASVVRQNARGVGLEWCEPAAGSKNVDSRLTALGGGINDTDELPLRAECSFLPPALRS